MIKLLQSETERGSAWKLQIDNELIEKVNISLHDSDLHLYVWFDKTSKRFFAQKGSAFFALQSDKIKEVEITISIKNNPENDVIKLLPQELFDSEFVKFINDNKDEDGDSSLFLSIKFDENRNIFATMQFLEFILAAQFWKLPFSMNDYSKKLFGNYF